MTLRLRRSALYVPGSNARAISKCRTVDADVIIFDLEDAVVDVDKAAALDAVVATLAQGGFGHREVVVRINALATDRGHQDLLAAAAARPGAILLPKVAGPGDVMGAAALLDEAGVAEGVRLWAMVETPAAVLDVRSLARTAADGASRLDALVMGTNDLVKELRVRVTPNRDALLVWLSTCVAAARSQRLDILDGVFNDLDDASGLSSEARQGRDFGMDGKTCIHPSQIAACNAVFAPEPDELVWARKVVAAFAQSSTPVGVLKIDGRMVERLHAEAAQRTLAMAAALAVRDPGGPWSAQAALRDENHD